MVESVPSPSQPGGGGGGGGGGGNATVSTEEVRRRIKQICAEGGGFLLGFKPPANYSYEKYANNSDPDLLPDSALPEHRPDFYHIWVQYRRQTAQTNLASLVPENISQTPDIELIKELANLAIQEYNEKECNELVAFVKRDGEGSVTEEKEKGP